MNFLLLLFLSTLRNLDNLINTNNQISSGQLQQRYDNYVLYSITFHNDLQRSTFENRTNAYKNFDFWQKSRKIWHIMISPNKLVEFMILVHVERLNTQILIPNIQRLIDQEEITQRKPLPPKFDWSRYHTFKEINAWLKSVIIAYPNVTQAINLGNSYEGRMIQGLKISYKPGNPGIFVESNTHAREWITSATATWIINELLTSNHIGYRYLAENYDWYILPILNVDGFVYTHERDRLWRKTHNSNIMNKRKSFGVDGNRNYNIHCMENDGALIDPCDETYAGRFVFSVPEIRSLANYVRSIKNRINIFLAFHSYGQKLLSPFDYTNSKRPDNYEDLMQVANAFSDAIATLPYQTKYQANTTSELLYFASGGTSDWAYEQGIRLSYTIEFRDQGQYGFLLPPAYIIPNSKEILTGIFAMVVEADLLGYMNLKYEPINLY